MGECSYCGTDWPVHLTRFAHCGGCHKNFSSDSAFDAHRRGDPEFGMRDCEHPELAGLVLRKVLVGEKILKVWGWKGSRPSRRAA
jgi:hypothetical protein